MQQLLIHNAAAVVDLLIKAVWTSLWEKCDFLDLVGAFSATDLPKASFPE
jgi:hypothetical protein